MQIGKKMQSHSALKMQDAHGISVVIDPNPKPLHHPRTATNLKLYTPTYRKISSSTLSLANASTSNFTEQ
jgi:hypothetical protein